MIAWYGEQQLKDAAMLRLREHRRLDTIVHGVYFDADGRGCHLGCLTHNNEDSHGAAERMFGIEKRVGYWLEAVFEGLPKDRCGDWVIDSTDAIPVGADLSLCHHHLAEWLLGPESPSAQGNQHEIVREAIAKVRELHSRAARGESIGDDEWSAAAESAARSAELAERSAERSAESAAWSAAWAAWEAIAAKSIEIFAAAPVRDATAGEQCDDCVRDAMLQLGCPVRV